ncbi:MAG: MarR family winged helix-turn-helix transcriptional regulator [Solirubrobacterales bacterium]
MSGSELRQADYEKLLGFRTALRRFLHWSEAEARAAGLTPAQHQLLLAVRGHPGPEGPTIGELAEYLLLRHHSVVELADRAVATGLVRRLRDKDDQRVVRLRLTADGERATEELALLHLEELRRLAPALRELGAGEDGRP